MRRFPEIGPSVSFGGNPMHTPVREMAQPLKNNGLPQGHRATPPRDDLSRYRMSSGQTTLRPIPRDIAETEATPMVPDLRCIETVSFPFQQRCVVQSNSVRSVPMESASESSARVLMIEPDTKRAVVLRNALRPRLDADLVIVHGIEEALRSIAKQIPDLVLTSTFLAPEDEATLTAHLKQIPDAAHVQVVNAPYFLDVNGEAPD